jgi:hypothetical protein
MIPVFDEENAGPEMRREAVPGANAGQIIARGNHASVEDNKVIGLWRDQRGPASGCGGGGGPRRDEREAPNGNHDALMLQVDHRGHYAQNPCFGSYVFGNSLVF